MAQSPIPPSSWPGAIDTFVDPAASDFETDVHKAEHAKLSAAVTGVETALGAQNATFVSASATADGLQYVSQVTGANDANSGFGWGAAAKATVQAAINALPAGGGKVLLGLGSYAMPATVPSNVTVEAPYGAILTTAATNGDVTSLAALGTGQTFRGVTFQSTGTGGSTGVYTQGSTDVTFARCRFTGTFGQALLIYQGSNCKVWACEFDAIGVAGTSTPGDAINVFGTTGASIVGCTFTNCLQDAVYFNSGTTHSVMGSCTVIGCPEGVQVRVNCAHITIENNAFSITGSSTVSSFAVDVDTGCTDIVVGPNTYFGVTGTAAPASAVQVNTDCKRVTVLGTISGTFQKGVVMLSATGHACSGCYIAPTITGTSSFGVQIGAFDTSSTDPNTVEARVTAGSDAGLLIQADHTIVRGSAGGCGNNGLNLSANNCLVDGKFNGNNGDGVVLNGNHNTIRGQATGNSGRGVKEYNTANNNIIVGVDAAGNTDATADISALGAATKIAYCQGRYTQQGAA